MIWWQIIIGLIILWIIYSKITQAVRHKNAIGQQMIVNYFDQNHHFETIFPKKGILTEKIKIGKVKRFFVVDFDVPFNYDNREFKKIVIQERHLRNYIGSDKEVHVHVLLPKTTLDKDKYSFDQFDHVVWATITPDKTDNEEE